MSDQTQHLPVKTSNLPDKCPMTGANLQACILLEVNCCNDIATGCQTYDFAVKQLW